VIPTRSIDSLFRAVPPSVRLVVRLSVRLTVCGLWSVVGGRWSVVVGRRLAASVYRNKSCNYWTTNLSSSSSTDRQWTVDKKGEGEEGEDDLMYT